MRQSYPPDVQHLLVAQSLLPGAKELLKSERVVNEGANLAVIETKSAGELLFRQQMDRVWLASPVQAYLDLLSTRQGDGGASEARKDRLLMAKPATFDGYVERSAPVSSTCLAAVARNRYSVPCEWAGHMVSTRLYPNRVAVAAADTLVASHPRLTGSGQTTYDWQHYIDLVQRKPGALRHGVPFLDMPPPLLRLRQSLLRHTGGDRVTAEVLAVVPLAGLE